ncbi:unnamed protein product, partial [Ectocarpus sp. 8 AP-2014]
RCNEERLRRRHHHWPSRPRRPPRRTPACWTPCGGATARGDWPDCSRGQERGWPSRPPASPSPWPPSRSPRKCGAPSCPEPAEGGGDARACSLLRGFVGDSSLFVVVPPFGADRPGKNGDFFVVFRSVPIREHPACRYACKK